MGGSYEEKFSGLRMHLSDNEVHVHDDSKSLKFRANPGQFKEDVQDAFSTLKKQEGIVMIEGKTRNELCIMKNQTTYSMFLMEKVSIKSQLESFIKKC